MARCNPMVEYDIGPIYIYSQMLFQMAKLTKLYQNVANDKNNLNPKYKMFWST
jgi:hypothetical protein